MKNPNWHPKSAAQLTSLQRHNLKRLVVVGSILPTGPREMRSFLSLARHNLAEQVGNSFRPTQQARVFYEFLAGLTLEHLALVFAKYRVVKESWFDSMIQEASAALLTDIPNFDQGKFLQQVFGAAF